MTTRADVRRQLARWGSTTEYCNAKQWRINQYAVLMDTNRGLSASLVDDMPRGTEVSDPTARAAEHVCDLSKDYEEAIASLRLDIAEALRFEERIDALVDTLPPEQQRVLRLRYVDGHCWVFIARKMNFSDDHVKHLDCQAVDALRKDFEVGTI